MAARGAKAKFLGQGSRRLGPQLLEKSVYVKGLNTTLLSVEKICDNDDTVIFRKKNAVVVNLPIVQAVKRNIVATAERRDNSGLYGSTQQSTKQCQSVSNSTHHADLWHRCLIYASSYVLEMVPRLTVGIKTIIGNLSFCHPCKLGKAHKKWFQSSLERLSFAGEFVHSDVVGPLPVSTEGHWYFRTFLDQYSCYKHVACILPKRDVASTFKAYTSLPDVQNVFYKRSC